MPRKTRARPTRPEDVRARLELARREMRAVGEGVAETVALERARGAAFVVEAEDSRARLRPYRRQPGLDWLARKGRISEAQRTAGLRYRDAYLIAQPTVAIGSTLEAQPGGGSGGPPLDALLGRAGRR